MVIGKISTCRKPQKELSGYEGRIWRHIVSLRREDADKLGYNTRRPWKLLIEAHLHELAEASGIKPENLRWYAGMHDEGHHPHIHLFVFSANPKEGYVTAQDIKKLNPCMQRISFGKK